MRRVIVIFPHADTGQVERFRARWDPLASSIAAHITVVFPFQWPSSTETLKATLANVARHHTQFAVDLGGTLIWQDEYLFLQARQGGGEIGRLHHDLYDAALPELPKPNQFVAHMTIARTTQRGELSLASTQANDTQLTVRGFAMALSVYRIEESGQRVCEFDIPLANPS